MKEITLRKYHRLVGVTASIFILLQVVSGLLLSIALPFRADWFGRVTDVIHFGDGAFGTIYRIALALALLFIVATGWWIFMKIASRAGAAQKKAQSPASAKRPVNEPAQPVK